MRHALWEDLDFEARTWTFTPRKTKRKTGVSLIVPLSDQVYDLFKQLEPHKRSDFVFPSLHSTMRPMSENTLGQALKRLGFSGEQHTVHGFRASARTMLVERLKYDESLVEMQLGHNVRDLHGRAYKLLPIVYSLNCINFSCHPNFNTSIFSFIYKNTKILAYKL